MSILCCSTFLLIGECGACCSVLRSVFFHSKPRDWLGKRLWNDVFCVEWDVKPNSVCLHTPNFPCHFAACDMDYAVKWDCLLLTSVRRWFWNKCLSLWTTRTALHTPSVRLSQLSSAKFCQLFRCSWEHSHVEIYRVRSRVNLGVTGLFRLHREVPGELPRTHFFATLSHAD